VRAPTDSPFDGSPSIAYSKKKDKAAQITFKKDETVKKDDVYKSSTVSVCSGEPADSISMPPAKRKPVAPRTVTNGKLLRPGGPSQTANVSVICPSNFGFRRLGLTSVLRTETEACRPADASVTTPSGVGSLRGQARYACCLARYACCTSDSHCTCRFEWRWTGCSSSTFSRRRYSPATASRA
jgi:hypothetical protein